jgi:hypothetical protein
MINKSPRLRCAYVPYHYCRFNSFQRNCLIYLRQQDTVPGGCVWAGESKCKGVAFDNVIGAAHISEWLETCGLTLRAGNVRQRVDNGQDCGGIGGDISG